VQPGRKKSVLEKISRKNMASSIKLRSDLISQKDQLAELEEMVDRVRELQENSSEYSYDTPSQLRADRWYSSKLADQMKILKARVEFIQKEIQNLYLITKKDDLKRKKIERLISEANKLLQRDAEKELEKKATFQQPKLP
jgi:Asp-tRNA(Asn)/Glu-tRNA(Gln) amidotransferase A subunit family amidase